MLWWSPISPSAIYGQVSHKRSLRQRLMKRRRDTRYQNRGPKPADQWVRAIVVRVFGCRTSVSPDPERAALGVSGCSEKSDTVVADTRSRRNWRLRASRNGDYRTARRVDQTVGAVPLSLSAQAAHHCRRNFSSADAMGMREVNSVRQTICADRFAS